MAKQANPKKTGGNATAVADPRGWIFSLLWAAAVVGVSIVASATINPLFGRYVHWDWMAGVAPAGFILLTLALRRRWV